MTKYNEEPAKPIVFIDMDGVLANFCASPMFEKADKIKNNPQECMINTSLKHYL
jgi:hypothetical protein